ncbi:hypothetical protein K470DRAFT_266581 [Piedraia hortae CBS 480.64]|uniref:Myb/SANT-like domain-containing protein n=1 Tax=Piedraia hortae CBS 480.64 TaxID=1314780 RepID=A0A6A7BS88_9PEZI|nr:hypothetical protein K470DRAFT_266581 [Piedraia hortae CBS 480.64]
MFKWCTASTITLITSLKQAKLEGKESNSRFKPEAWSSALDVVHKAIAEDRRPHCTLQATKNLYQIMQSDYPVWKRIKERSSWCINEKGCPTAEKEVMDDYIKHTFGPGSSTRPL